MTFFESVGTVLASSLWPRLVCVHTGLPKTVGP